MENNFFVHESSYIDENVEIGEGAKIWHFCHILSGVRIGKNCSIGQNCVIGPNVTIGDNCKIQNNVSLYDGLIIEDNVFIGPSSVFTNVLNPRAFVNRKDEFKKTVLKQGCSIGANTTIICGNTVGAYCLVAAGSVLTKSIEPHTVYAGNPARYKGLICKCGKFYGKTNLSYFCKDCI